MNWKANIKQGQLVLINRQGFLDKIKSMKDGAVNIKISRPKRKRTVPQNDRYWVIYCTQLGDYLGYIADEMHGIYKYLILKPNFGYNSTTELSTIEFSEYCEKIEYWAYHEHNFTFDIN